LTDAGLRAADVPSSDASTSSIAKAKKQVKKAKGSVAAKCSSGLIQVRPGGDL